MIYCNQNVILTNWNVKKFFICVTTLASLFACKIHVFFDTLKNEEAAIQGRELRNQNSKILFAIENQVLLCPVHKTK